MAAPETVSIGVILLGVGGGWAAAMKDGFLGKVTPTTPSEFYFIIVSYYFILNDTSPTSKIMQII